MLKRMGESRHPCRTPTVFLEPVSYAAVEEDGTSGLVTGVLMTCIRFVLILYFFMVANKAACQTLLKAFLKSMKLSLIHI